LHPAALVNSGRPLGTEEQIDALGVAKTLQILKRADRVTKKTISAGTV